jgi:hypothetical protein
MQSSQNVSSFKDYSRTAKLGVSGKIWLAEVKATTALDRRKFLLNHHTCEIIGDIKRIRHQLHRDGLVNKCKGMKFRGVLELTEAVHNRMIPALEAHDGLNRHTFIVHYAKWHTSWQERVEEIRLISRKHVIRDVLAENNVDDLLDELFDIALTLRGGLEGCIHGDTFQ